MADYEDDKVLFFGGPWACFSNFYASQVYLWGILWPTSEHAYHAAKFLDRRISDEIRFARGPYEALLIAKANKDKIRPQWNEETRLAVMEEIVVAKAQQHPYIMRKLIETGQRLIIEDSPDDSFWGRGPDGNGRNELGKIWMKVRSYLMMITK
jgi:ribA/ribD-fused uncharacterized protein